MSVAKVVIIDQDGAHLLLHRSDHPHFGTDPDLPGGGIEDGESPYQGVIREIYEETGIVIGEDTELTLLHQGVEFSRHNTHYSLFSVQLPSRPDIVLSWEHSRFDWVSREELIEKAAGANDTFMHMVAEKLSSGRP